MAKKKYYAVLKGLQTGIYDTWDECKEQVHGVAGCIYKSFGSLEEAQAFLDSAENGTDEYSEDIVSTKDCLVAYVDGSYLDSVKKYAYGCVMVLEDGEVTLNGSGSDADYLPMRNVAGEILGSENAILWAIEHGYKKVIIFYDYEGIEKWANDIWQANKPGTIRYKRFISDKRKDIGICFQKVDAHTGVKYNEMADRLAKQALGII